MAELWSQGWFGARYLRMAETKEAPKPTIAQKRKKPRPNKKDDVAATVLEPLSPPDAASFSPLSLPQIRLRLRNLLDTLPRDLPAPPPDAPASPDAAAAAAFQRHYAPIKAFAGALQVATEEYNLLLGLVASATYRWGVDRSGAAQQNLSVLSGELQQCQDVISNVISARLSNVLCPAVDVVVGEVEIVRGATSGEENGAMAAPATAHGPAKKRKMNADGSHDGDMAPRHNERRLHHYTRPLVDPSYVHLCHCVLARNAALIRHTVATSIHTAQRAMEDYLKATEKEAGEGRQPGGYY